jgi:hypothetical protein
MARAQKPVVGTQGVVNRGKLRTVAILAYPVTFSPHPQQIEAARRAYDDWRLALDWLREGLVAGSMLRQFALTDAMPRERPWEPQ